MPFNDPMMPYNELPLLPPRVGLDLVAVINPLGEARAALARLNQAAKTSPYTQALITTIPLVEAQASSEIENIVTTQDELFSAAVDKANSGDSALESILRYRSAMHTASEYLKRRPITAELAKVICSEIMGYSMNIRDMPGTKLGVDRTGAHVYTPPFGAEIFGNLLDNLADYINTSELDPLIRMALSHYQFEAIHPFYDGNGRTGRILNLLQLQAADLLAHPVLHLSRVIKDDRINYYRLLRLATEEREYTEWVKFMLEKVRAASDVAYSQLDMLAEYAAELEAKCSDSFYRGIPEGLIAVLTEYPYCTIQIVVEQCKVSRPTAAKWLEKFEETGFLNSILRGRNKYFVNAAVLDILNI
jgi:Fic family protein